MPPILSPSQALAAEVLAVPVVYLAVVSLGRWL